MYRFMKCLKPPKSRDVQAVEEPELPPMTDKSALDKGPPSGHESGEGSDLLKPSSLRMFSGNEKSETQDGEDAVPHVAVAKGSDEGDTRGVWRVHVQAGDAAHGNAGGSPQLADDPNTASDRRPAQPCPAPAAKQDTSSPAFPKHFTLRTDACTPSPDTIVVSSAQATCQHKTVDNPIAHDADTDGVQHSAGSAAVVTPPVTLNARSRSTHGATAEHRASKLPTQCSETSDSGSPPLPVAIAPEATPQEEQGAAPAAKAKHIELAGELGLPLDHEAFSLWRLAEPLGSGAFSKVYLSSALGTLRRDLPRACVIKVVNLGAGCKIRDDYKPILRSEGIALQRFRFPGFVQCYASWGSAPPLGQQDEDPPSHLVLALEHLTGGMLLDRLKKGPLAEHHAAAAFHQILTCILYMHHSGYLHRDLKPDNVMLADDWDPERDAHVPPPVKLIDLGMVLNYVEQPNETGLMGSPGYMSPEAIRGHRHTPQMDMYSLGVLLFVMLTGCKPIPSAICTKLSYDRLETADYPGVKMQQFRRLSAPARELVLALMARRPADRPCAMAAMLHPWLHGHAERWRAAGVDLSELALPKSELQDAVRRAPRVDELVARARAQRPLPPSAGSSKVRGSAERSRAATPTRRLPAVDVAERGTPTDATAAGAITADAGADAGQENLEPSQRRRQRSRQATPTAAETPTSPAPTPTGIPARPPLARQGSTAQVSTPTAASPVPTRQPRPPAAAAGGGSSVPVAPGGGSLTAGQSTAISGGENRSRGTPLRRDISNALSDTIDNILDLIQQQSGTTSACAPAGTPCGSAFTGPLTPAMHPAVWGSQYGGGLARMRSRSGSLPIQNGDSMPMQGSGGSSFVMSSAIPPVPLEGAAAVSTTPGSQVTPVSPARGMVGSIGGKVSGVPSRSINRALTAVFHAAETVADADYSALPSPAVSRAASSLSTSVPVVTGAPAGLAQSPSAGAMPVTKRRSRRSGRVGRTSRGHSGTPRGALSHLQYELPGAER
eukprot:jgi/Ulvmu1/10978/UM007_0157.1